MDTQLTRNESERANAIIDGRYAIMSYMFNAIAQDADLRIVDILDRLEGEGFDSADIVDLLGDMPASMEFLQDLSARDHKEFESIKQRTDVHRAAVAHKKQILRMEVA
ncbi:hypothetical protein N9Z27_02830, partial [Alphaproteobacteria bacterium]|nr:hypothetical protein [Alphaproteobacteria bacterium]